MRKLIVSALLVASVGLMTPSVLRAEDNVQTCTTVTQYNGSVSYICGSHAPVNTGLGDNLALVGALILGTSGFLLFLSKRANKVA